MCDILAAISYGYGHHHHHLERPRKKVKINMTIPSRPAPPPPQRSAAPPSRYTPTTDWDFCAFDSGNGGGVSADRTLTRDNNPHAPQQQHHSVRTKKPPPPRPPPPKLPTAPLKKPGQPQSINILSSLFGHKRASNGAAAPSVAKSGAPGGSSLPIKLLPPPAPVSSAKGGKTASQQHQASGGFGTATTHINSGGHAPGSATAGELISFDSPPSSPTFTQKSCSDCISVDSFSSDSNYSSPHNGNMSQAESGFEDDFVTGNRVGSCIPWVETARFDPFDVGSTTGSRAPSAPPPGIYAPLPLPTGSSAAQIRTPLVNSKLQKSDFVDPLCNGRSVLSKVPTVSMPTIIKPPGSGSASQKSTPSHSAASTTARFNNMQPPMFASKSSTAGGAGGPSQRAMNDDLTSSDVSSFESPPSPPMPSIPPPPPPPSSFEETYSEEPHGFALYDYEGETMEDLSFKTNEKIYLLSRLNEEWYMGRDRRGLEGMFPVNYVEVKVPLSAEQQPQNKQQRDESAPTEKAAGTQKVRALYQFIAETADDLTIMENELVTVLYQITPDWLYGETNGRRGQFPSNYIEYVPTNLPLMPASLGRNS